MKEGSLTRENNPFLKDCFSDAAPREGGVGGVPRKKMTIKIKIPEHKRAWMNNNKEMSLSVLTISFSLRNLERSRKFLNTYSRRHIEPTSYS